MMPAKRRQGNPWFQHPSERRGAEVQAARLHYDLIEARYCARREPVLTKEVKNARRARDGVERVIGHYKRVWDWGNTRRVTSSQLRPESIKSNLANALR
jgi:hypothetical protein